MKENDKNVAEFVEKLMKETPLETPSFDFTSKIMAHIAVSEQVKMKQYKPLISKPVWFGIFGILFAIVGYSIFGNVEKTKIEMDFISKISGLIPNVQFSEVTTYSVLIVTLMVLVQIPLLKNYFDKRFEV